MLKLLKYEIKQTWKMCTTFLIIISLGCLGFVFNPFEKYFMASFFYINLLMLVVVGISISLFVYCIGSFDQEFTKSQGYLIMTLPIKTRDFILAKFINNLIWYIMWFHIMVFFAYYHTKIYGRTNILEFYMGYMHGITIPDYFQLYLNGISSYILVVFIAYFSIVIFSMQTSKQSSVLKKVILAIGLNYIVGTIINTLSFVIPYGMQYNVFNKTISFLDLKQYIQTNAYSLKLTNTIIKLIVSYLFYIGTKQIIEKKVQI